MPQYLSDNLLIYYLSAFHLPTGYYLRPPSVHLACYASFSLDPYPLIGWRATPWSLLSMPSNLPCTHQFGSLLHWLYTSRHSLDLLYIFFCSLLSNCVLLGCWRDGSVVRSTCCCFRRPEFGFLHPQGSSQPSVTPVSGLWMPSSGLQEYCMHTDAHKLIYTH